MTEAFGWWNKYNFLLSKSVSDDKLPSVFNRQIINAEKSALVSSFEHTIPADKLLLCGFKTHVKRGYK